MIVQNIIIKLFLTLLVKTFSQNSKTVQIHVKESILNLRQNDVSSKTHTVVCQS